jgi:hypothetical protein
MGKKSRIVHRAKVGRKFLAFAFLKDSAGNSVARSEFQSLQASSSKAMTQVIAHIASVEAIKSVTGNAALAKATHEPGTAPHPDLYWWDYRGVGVFYTYDGTDLVVVLAGRVSNAAPYSVHLGRAKGRV